METNEESLRISSVLSKVEPDLSTGSDQKVPVPIGSGSATLVVEPKKILGSGSSPSNILPLKTVL